MRYVVVVARPNEFDRMVAADAVRLNGPRVRGRKGDFIEVDDCRYIRVGERSAQRLRGFSGPTELRISPAWDGSAEHLAEIRRQVAIMNATSPT